MATCQRGRLAYVLPRDLGPRTVRLDAEIRFPVIPRSDALTHLFTTVPDKSPRRLNIPESRSGFPE